MPSVPSPPFDSKPSKRKVQIVVDDDQIFPLHPKKMNHFLDGLSTPVHVGQRFGEDDGLGMDRSFSEEGLKASSVGEDMVCFGESVHCLKSDVVPVPLVVGPWVPQTYNDFHIRLFFLLFLRFLLLLHLCPFSSHLCNYLFHYLFLSHRWYDR